MQALHKKYKVRSGTIDFGKEYEFKMVALFSLRCIVENVEEMWIVANADGVGAFDDIVLNVRTAAGGNFTFMMQLKHTEKPKNITKDELLSVKGDFSLVKYFKDIQKLKQSIELKTLSIANDLGAFDSIYFVLFTNRGVNSFEILEKSDHEMSPLVNTDNGDVYKCNLSKLFPNNVDLSSTSDACNKFFLYSKQTSAKHVDEQIVTEIKKIFKSLGITQINAKIIAKDFIDYVTNWAKGNFGEHYYLTKQEVLCKFSELLLKSFELNLNKEPFTFYDCPKKLLWNEIVQDENLILIDVNSNGDLIYQFLFEYIGSEVKKYCKDPLEDWIDNLSEQNKNYIYQHVLDKNFKKQILKMVGNHGEITALDIYKCLYMIKKLPFLLKVGNLQDYENILRILKFSKRHFKIIVVNKCEKNLTTPSTHKSFRVLQDLRQEYRNKILKLHVKLQGRKSVSLGTLVDDEICKHIKCRDIIDILLNNFNIGNEIKAAPEYFIERSFSKILIWPRILHNNNDEIFLVEATIKKHLNRLPIRNKKVFKWEDIDFERLNGSIIVSGLENATSKQMKKLKSTGRKIHYFTIYNAQCLEWKWSVNSIKNLIPYRINDKVFENDLQQKILNSINIVSAPPGMGKTFLMESVARQAPRNKWLLKIDLNTSDGREHYINVRKQSNTESGAHLRHFNYHLLNKISCNTKLVQMIFEKLLKAKNITVLLDGFDEVSFLFKDEVTDIAKSLYRDGYQIWLTTRPHMTSYLEEQLNTFSFTLKPFDMDDQKFFLRKYFGTLNPNLSCSSRLLNKFINKLLQAARNNLNDKDAEFTGIPLQTKLLGDVFNDDCRKYLYNNGKTKFNENFDLLSLYQILIEKKIDILCEKFGHGTEAHMRVSFKDHQSLFAYKLLFPLNCLEGSYVKEILEDSYKNKQNKLELLQGDGIITVDENLNVSCVHQTFAEYLLAQWMSENLSNKNENIAEIVQYLLQSRFLGLHSFLHNVFDRIVAENCSLPLLKSLHLAVINSEITKVKRILNENPNIVSEVDNCGRSVLHMIVLYAVQFPLPFDPNYVASQTFNSDNMLKIIRTISDEQIKMIRSDMLGYNPLDYAISNCSLSVAKEILEKTNTSTTNAFVNLHPDIRHDYLGYCAVLNYKRLFKILLPFFMSRNVLLRRINAHLHVSIKNYIDNDLIKSYNEGINIKENISGKMTLLELLQSNIGNSYSGYSNNNYYSNLSFAIALGTEKNVDNILRQDINLNKRDCNLCTPLHYATIHGKPKIVDALLSKGANTVIQSSHLNAALHLAIFGYRLSVTHTSLNPQGSRDDYYNIIVELVKKGANIKIQNASGLTPLHCILSTRYIFDDFIVNNFDQRTKTQLLEIVRLLISNGADVNMRTLGGYTSLHIAAINFLEECLTEILNNGADVNQITNEGLSPFHCLLFSEHAILSDQIKTLKNSNAFTDYTWIYDKKERIVKELVARGTNINQRDNDGETPLHLAMIICCFISHCRLVKVILEEGADVNIQNYSGNTPLHIALINSKLEILYHENLIELLLNKNFDVNLQNYDGNTPLHLMAETFKFSIPHFKVLVTLLNKGANTNLKNLNRKSVLELAYDNGNMEMTCILYYFIVRKLLRLYPNLVLQI